MGAVVVGLEVDVDLVGLVDGVDCRLDVPEAVFWGTVCQLFSLSRLMQQREGSGHAGNLLLDGDVVADTSELALDADPVAVVRGGLDRVEGRAALGARVLVVV